MWNELGSIDWNLSSYCQAKCPSCPRTNEQTLETSKWLSLVHVDYNDWLKIVQGRNWENTIFTYCGEHGDPMMHPEITKFVKWGADNSRMVHIHTNGGLRKPEWYVDILNYSPHILITFSIDGLSQETNEQYRIGVNWQRSWDNMIASIEAKPRQVVWDYIVFEHNWQEIPRVVELAEEYDVRLRMKMNGAYYNRLTNPEGIKLFEEYS